MADRQMIVEELGSRLMQAARASVAAGAQYNPGEPISTDARQAWLAIADTIVTLIEVKIREHHQIE